VPRRARGVELADALESAGFEALIATDTATCLERLRYGSWTACVFEDSAQGRNSAAPVVDRMTEEQIDVPALWVDTRDRNAHETLVDRMIETAVGGGSTAIRGRTIHAGPLSIDPARSDAYVDDRPLHLAWTDFRVLYLLAVAGRPLDRENLAAQLDLPPDVSRRAIDIAVARIRRRLAEETEQEFISTLYGAGYVFDPTGNGSRWRTPEAAQSS
jgi:DNA-binding winged helix-turn-helix (wHTH) protein